MLLPILTSTKHHRFPAVVLLLVLVNAAIFLMTKDDILAAAGQWGFTPGGAAQGSHSCWPQEGRFETFVTHAFLHGGWIHLIGNMWMLAVFGSALETKLGHVRFLALYFVFALAAVLAHGLFQSGPPRPAIGASGAISGVLGCYVALEPRSRVLSIFFLGIVFFFTEIPTLFYVAVWLIIQIDGIQTHLLTSPECRNIAWWAHLGGFAIGGASGLLISALQQRKAA